MPATRPPAPQERSLARDAELPDLLNELEPVHPRNSTLSGEVFLCLAVGPLSWCGPSRALPLPLDGTWERFLTFRRVGVMTGRRLE